MSFFGHGCIISLATIEIVLIQTLASSSTHTTGMRDTVNQGIFCLLLLKHFNLERYKKSLLQQQCSGLYIKPFPRYQGGGQYSPRAGVLTCFQYPGLTGLMILVSYVMFFFFLIYNHYFFFSDPKKSKNHFDQIKSDEL